MKILKFLCVLTVMMFMKNKYQSTSICTLILMFNLSSQFAEMSKMSYLLMGDLMSFWLTDLSMWIISMITLIKINNKDMMNKLNIILTIVLMITFYNWNFMTFFVMFEMSMIIIMVIVMSWGYQPERIEATMFMIVLTSMFSLPFFSALMYNQSSLNMWLLTNNPNIWDYVSFMLIFMVKMPVYFIHIWLPKVHVESPVQGSMILAAIMLKLGCFGMIRMNKMSTKMTMSFEHTILAFAMWTTLIMSMVCNIQSDLKSLIAYSSVVHMSMAFVSITLTKSKSIMASVILMLGHGACSSAMFFMCNQAYKVSKSRSMIMNKGIMNTAPTASTMWFMLCMMNAPMPPSINIVGELLSFKTVMAWSSKMLILMFLIMLMSSCYSIIVFCVVTHGKFSKNTKTPMKINSKSALIVLMHIIPGITMIAKMSLLTI